MRTRSFLSVVVLVVAGAEARAQTTYSQEFWPEIDLHYRFDERTQIIAMGTNSRNKESDRNYQAEAGVVLERYFTDWFSGRIGYRHGHATDGGSYREDRLLVEQTLHVALPGKVLVDFRTREDFRWLNTGFSVRLRERAQVQRDFAINDYVFTPYVSAEIYFDTRFDQIARYRLIVGSTFPIWRSSVALEPYVAHQVDVAGSSAIVNALGMILHVYF